MHCYLVRNKTVLWDSEYPEISLVYRQDLICCEPFSKSTLAWQTGQGRSSDVENRSISLMMLHRRAKLKAPTPSQHHHERMNRSSASQVGKIYTDQKREVSSICPQHPFCNPFLIQKSQVRQWWFSITQLSTEDMTTGLPNCTVGCCFL